MAEPLRIRFDEERHAVALADELAGLAPIEVSRNSHAWEVSIDDLQTKGFLVSTLEAVRRTLSGQPSATAVVASTGTRIRCAGNKPDPASRQAPPPLHLADAELDAAVDECLGRAGEVDRHALVCVRRFGARREVRR